MSMRILCTVLGLYLFASPSPFLKAEEGSQPSKPKKKRMNVVIIFTDDQGYADVGCFGAKGFKTPNLDRMAKQGARFSSFYVSTAVCSASRSALMTGCYHTRVDIHGAFGPGRVGLHQNEVTIAELLKQLGYRCGCFGKWHLGSVPDLLPAAQGFDEYFGLPYSNDMSPSPKNNPLPQARKRWPPLPLISGTKVIQLEPDQSQLTKWYTEKAVKFIKKNKDEPFFCYLAHSMPHVPLYASKNFKGKTKRGLYGDVITEIDWSVGQILETLKNEGLDENTLVIFTSDNGPWLTFGNHGGSAFPLREGKGTIFEGGVRVPCVMRWPGHIPAGHICDEPAMTIDILPTIAKLTGAKLPKHKIDGKNIWPLMQGEENAKSPHEAYYFWYSRELRAVRMGKWKLHFPHRYRTLTGPPGMDGNRANQGSDKIGLSLFDLEKDIGEKNNVLEKHPDVVAKITKLAEKMRGRLGDRLTKTKGKEVRPLGKSKLPPTKKGKKKQGKREQATGKRGQQIDQVGEPECGGEALGRPFVISRDQVGAKPTQPQTPNIKSVIAALESENATTRQRALDRLALLGPKAEAAVPALAKLVSKGTLGDKVRAVYVLGTIGKKAEAAVPILTTSLDSKDFAIVKQAGLSLLQIQGPTLKTTTKLLGWPGKSPAPGSHYWGYLTSGPVEVTPHLIHLFGSKNKIERQNAAVAIGPLMVNSPSEGSKVNWAKINESAQAQIVSGLLKLTKDPAPEVVEAAVSSLVLVAPEQSSKVIPVIVGLLQQKQISSYTAWRLLGNARNKAIEPFLEALDTEDRVVRQQIGYTLGAIAAASPKLILSLKSESRNVRAGAAFALGMNRAVPEASEPLRKALKDSSEEVRLNAAQALLRINGKDEGKNVVPVLRGVLASKDGEFRARAALNLSRIPMAAEEALPELLRALKDKELRVRTSAARAVVLIDPKQGGAIVPTIADALKSKKLLLQGALLAPKIGDAAKRLVPELTGALETELKKLKAVDSDADRNVIYSLAVALGNGGPKAKKAVPLLVEAMDATSGYEGIGAALAKLDAPESRLATRGLLLSPTRTGDNLLFPNYTKTLKGPGLQSKYLFDFPGLVAWHLIELVGDKQATVREEAAEGLGILYAPSSPLVKKLKEQFAKTTKAVVPTLRKALSDQEVRVQLAAGRALVRIDREQIPYLLPKMIRWLSESHMPRYEIVLILSKSERDSVSLLIKAFDEVPDPAPVVSLLVRPAAVSKALPRLGDALGSKSAKIRTGAAYAFAEFARTTPRTAENPTAWKIIDKHVPTLRMLLTDSDPKVRFESARALLHVNQDEDVPKILKVFMEAVQDKNGAVRYRGVAALGKMRGKAKEAIPVLNKALKTTNTPFLLEVAQAIIAIDPKQAGPTISRLQTVLTEGNAIYSREAAQTLALLGPDGKSALPDLKKTLDSKSPSVRFEAGRAMVLIDPEQIETVLPNFVDLLKDTGTSSYVKRVALEFLVSVPKKKAIPGLEPLLGAKDERLKLAVALALVKIDPEAMKSAWGVVSSKLKETKTSQLRDEIFDVLTDLGPKAKPALPVLIDLLKSKDRNVRRETVYVLERMGSAAKSALPAMRKLLFDTANPTIVRAAQRAMTRIQKSK
ncbi:MAG: HEAT repeat domain-containing protein [Gemmataceae bacterium]